MKLTADDLKKAALKLADSAESLAEFDGPSDSGCANNGGELLARCALMLRSLAEQQDAIAEYIAARDDLEAAESPPNSHARPRVVSQGDSRLLRWREARAALSTRSPQPAKTYTFDEILDERGPEHRAKVEKRFEELLADYNSQEPVSSPQPAKPAGAVLPRYGFPRGIQTGESPQPMSDGYWTPWHVAYLVIAGLREERDAREAAAGGAFDLLAHLIRQREWSERTFGPGNRTAGVIDHIRKELIEVESSPDDVTEWIDIVILALDGAWRAGHDAAAIISAFQSKQAKNESRTWPDWRNADPSKAIEHDRSGEPAAIPQQPTAEPVVEGVTHWEENARYLLDRCKHSIRVREGGGPENLLSSLIVTFMGMERRLAIKAEPVVEATGTVNGFLPNSRAIEIIMDPLVPRWIAGKNTRVTISPAGGKSADSAATPT